MNIDYKMRHISSVVKYIESNLSFEINTDMLIKFGFTSRSQLYRDFYNVTGHSVKEYIRKRRLSNALNLVKNSNFGLADIAYYCGYSSQQALCRCITRSIGIRTTEYKESRFYYFFPPYQGFPLNDVSVASNTIPELFCLTYYNTCLDNIENMAIDYFFSLVPEYSGRIFGRNGQQRGKQFCYKLFISDYKDYIQSIQSSRFEMEGKYDALTSIFAVSNVENKKEQISFAWDYLYSEWLSDSMFACTNNNYFEEYIIKNKRIVKLRLFIEIHQRMDYPKIHVEENPDLYFLTSSANSFDAEKSTSQAVLEYIADHHSNLLKTIKEFFVKKDVAYYTCGVRLYTDINIYDNSLVKIFAVKEGTYLVLSANNIGDYDKFEHLLRNFAENNGLSSDTDNIFAVYEKNENGNDPSIIQVIRF